MPKKTGIVFVLAGTVLILSALSLFLYNRYEDAHAGQEAESLLSDVQTIIDERETSVPTTPPETLAPELPIAEIEGYGYVGYISIPKLELELPVMSEWDYKRLNIAPCRYAGSTKTSDLVLAGHNYRQHFGRLSSLSEGDAISFVDMDGVLWNYEVAAVETLGPDAVEQMTSGEYDLTLFTCTYDGSLRVTIRCEQTE